MPRLFLHIGTHKTGTTSLQRFLSSNRPVLRELGLVYPGPAFGGFETPYAHHPVANAMAERPGFGTPADARRFFDALRRDLGPNEVAVVSAEALYRHVLPEGEPDDPSVFIRGVRECLGDFDVTILVMLRRQDSFTESLYAEQVMASAYREDIDQYVVERGWLADYDARLAMWASVFGAENISVRTFEPASFPDGIERSFLDWVGVRWDDRLTLTPVANVTLPRALVEYKRALNSGQSRTISMTYRGWLENLAATSPDGALPDLGRHYLTHEALLALRERYAAGNQRVAEQYLGRSELFTDPGSTAPYPPPPPLRPAHFRQITRRLLRSLV